MNTPCPNVPAKTFAPPAPIAVTELSSRPDIIGAQFWPLLVERKTAPGITLKNPGIWPGDSAPKHLPSNNTPPFMQVVVGGATATANRFDSFTSNALTVEFDCRFTLAGDQLWP